MSTRPPQSVRRRDWEASLTRVKVSCSDGVLTHVRSLLEDLSGAIARRVALVGLLLRTALLVLRLALGSTV
jgi:hypothetical protein